MEMNLNRFANKKVIISSARFVNVAFSNGSILKYVTDRIIQKKNFGIPDKEEGLRIWKKDPIVLKALKEEFGKSA